MSGTFKVDPPSSASSDRLLDFYVQSFLALFLILYWFIVLYGIPLRSYLFYINVKWWVFNYFLFSIFYLFADLAIPYCDVSQIYTNAYYFNWSIAYNSLPICIIDLWLLLKKLRW